MPAPGSPRPRRRVLRRLFSVRSLMLLILAVSASLGWISYRARVQRNSVSAIRKAGGTVVYDLNWRVVRGPTGDLNRHSVPPRYPRITKWLVDTLGIDHVSTVWHVAIVSNVDDRLLARVGELTHLRQLSLRGGSGTDAGLAHLRGLTKLNSLAIVRGDASYTGAGLRSLAGLHQLQSLQLRDIPASDSDVAFLANMPELRNLEIVGRGVALSDTAMAHLSNMRHLRTLILSTADLTDTGMSYLRGLRELWCLRLGSTRVTSRGLGALENMLGLSDIWMAHSHIDDLSPIRRLVRMENLCLGECPLDDAGLAPISGYKVLGRLHLYESKVTGAGLKRLHELKSFRVLQFGGGRITDADLDELAALSIYSLYLNGAAITDAGLLKLRALPAVHTLSLAGTQISDAGLADLGRFPSLGDVDLSHTNITNAGLLNLASAGQAKQYLQVRVAGTKITDAGVAAVQSVRPSWQIIR